MKKQTALTALLILALLLASCATTKPSVQTGAEPQVDDGEALFSGFPDELPPVSQEQLRAMLAEIVERERRIIGAEESGTAVDEGNCTYVRAYGNTHLVSMSESAPYYYFRVRNADTETPVPNYIQVVYARATKKNMRNYYLRQKIARSMPAQLLLGYRDLEESYGAAKSGEISFEAAVEIAGVPYEVFFTDVESN